MKPNEIYLTHTLAIEKDESGTAKKKIKGTAYSGAVIEEHGWIKNLIIDLSTLSVAKPKTPILKDHMANQVAGHSKVTISDSVVFEGELSQKSLYGKEILDLAEDGVDWEMSLGVHGGQLVEFEDETINGIEMRSGTVLRNGVIREISVVALGADKDTNAQIFKLNKGEQNVKLTEEQYSKLLLDCGCGGKTTPEELSKDFNDAKAEAEKLKADIAAKQAEIDALKADLAKIQEAGDEEKREEELSAAVKEKGIEMADEKIKLAAKSKDQTETLLSFIKDMKAVKIDPKFTEQVDLSGGLTPTDKKSPEAIRLAAQQLVDEKKAANFMDAVLLVNKEIK